MYIDRLALMSDLQKYASPKARLTRMIRSGEVIRVRRGIFLDGRDTSYSLRSLAAVIYGPSYISFEYALSVYGLIPERVTIITSAAFNKNKDRYFHTPVGNFHYYYLPAAVYPYGVLREEERGQSYLMAAPEKALCDTLYKVKGITSRNALEALLLEDWRIDRERIMAMDQKSLRFLAPLYRKRILILFLEWLNQEATHA
jgi:hypothetical protein